MKKYLILILAAALPVVVATVVGDTVGLGDLSVESATQGWGQLQINKSVSGQPLAIAGKTYAHGLGTHAASEIVYELDGEYTNFSAWVGVDDDMKGYTNSTVVFQVFGNGKKLFDSGVMRLTDPAKRVSVDVADVQELKLVVTDAGDGISCDHADWADAALLGRKTATTKTAKYSVGMIKLSEDGEIVEPLAGKTKLGGCRQVGDVVVKKVAGGYEFTRKLADSLSHSAMVTDRFTPTKNSVRWEIEITSDDKPWTTAITTQLHYPVGAKSRFWTTWGDPVSHSGWTDPLETRPFATRSWAYQYRDWHDFFGGGEPLCFSIPLLTVLEPQTDRALSLVCSPEDTQLALDLATTEQGGIRYTRKNHRLGGGRAVRFAMDLVASEADTRSGLGWMRNRYPRFFLPPNPAAAAMAGCGAYSGNENPIDVAKFKKMAFRINWKLSDDFPYIGMYIPPVKDAAEQWRRSCAEPTPPGKGPLTSCAQLDRYAQYMETNGFYVLNYFNVTEFGKDMRMDAAPAKGASANAPDLWKNPSVYLQTRLAKASLHDFAGRPRMSNCYGACIVDFGDPDYLQHILDVAERHIRLTPHTAGICIDRTDWLNCYNPRADDGVSFVEGQPVRSLFVSWKMMMAKLGPLMHRAGKVIFINNCTPRLEVLEQADGVYCEWERGQYYNFTALTCFDKPALMWIYSANDDVMQRCLHLGIYPTAPYPSNNHCIDPSPAADKLYLDYGPLLDAMRGKKWVLAPHCVETTTPGVKVNLFEVPGGYVLPVTFGGKAETATVQLRNIPGLAKLKAVALHPGIETPVAVNKTLKTGVLEFTVPLVRGCAMVKLIK